jgi:flagellar basal body-associated protein FliL
MVEDITRAMTPTTAYFQEQQQVTAQAGAAKTGMSKNTKIAIGVAIGVAVLLGGAIIIGVMVNNNKKKDEDDDQPPPMPTANETLPAVQMNPWE